MTNLRSLELRDIDIDDEFFSVMAELASGTQVKLITDLPYRIRTYLLSVTKIIYNEINDIYSGDCYQVSPGKEMRIS